MRRPLRLLILLTLVLTVGVGAEQETHATTTSPIQHIVFLIKENPSLDHYLGRFPGADGAITGKVKVNGVVKSIPLGAFQNSGLPDYSHQWAAAHTDYDGGAMDQF